MAKPITRMNYYVVYTYIKRAMNMFKLIEK